MTGNPEKLVNLCFKGMCFKYLCFKHCLNIYSFGGGSLWDGDSVIDDAKISIGKEILGFGWCSAGLWSPDPSGISQGGLGGGHLSDRRKSLHLFLCGDLN